MRALREAAAIAGRGRAAAAVLRFDVPVGGPAGPHPGAGPVLGAGRGGAAADGCWHDARGEVIAWTCAAHRELAGELARAGLSAGRKPGRWVPAGIAWHPAPPRGDGSRHDRLSVLSGEHAARPSFPWPAGFSLTG
ncbi:MAG: hypothetical protein ACRDOH_01545, partial [Streptosporangiaceae bacterium]